MSAQDNHDTMTETPTVGDSGTNRRPQMGDVDTPEPQPSGLTVGGVPGKATLAATGMELVRTIHSEVYRRMGEPQNVGELNGIPQGEASLVNQGRLEEAELARVYAHVTGLPLVDEEELREVDVFPDVSFDFLSHHNCLPAAWDGAQVVLAVASPYRAGDLALIWRAMFQRDASFVLARRTLIERHLTALYDTASEDSEGIDWDADSEQALRDLAREAPIVRLVNDMFSRAQEMGASDIHVEPAEIDLAIRFRVDGVLQTIQTPPMNQYPAIASRVKLLAGMNIAERRLPQDGRIDLNIGRTRLDVRVSTVPSMHGESIVLRLLQKDVTVFDLDKVGLDAGMRSEFERMVHLPHGMILVVGPTGSGKTTTLYCAMRMLNSDTRKIITIEDPVEYQLEGLTQIHVRSQIGLTFASGLRSIVRQDPDVILVGEIRDRETAEIAIHAALTGHLVLSTLHTNDASGAVSRLLDMGVESFLISSALLGVLSQRLVRRICPDCHGAGHVDDQGNPDESGAKRCRNCLGNGFKGRVGIFEMLVVNDELRTAINQRKDSNELGAIARRHGMRPLREDGALKVAKGITTEAEVARVCQLDFMES
ncbi:MAG: type II/IV secretion system protein [Lentisphaerae bacterium]|jgi:general secretion pathway protein E|nr:type II/IV secretion system protein [Lentisphaerota bacterium]MBT4818263.1 type II/IV secretion system protein [Lentisphaerota bacterium]MBT5606635.1 type II/IV secretion system protein [Lentisphaerota bacterium]MBT7059522.1 type II/IV secretion system protein [Lentisphaerota bacterium]MBT7843041.1 type II/IV secretion system protein [Lentisphaerota bacterium]